MLQQARKIRYPSKQKTKENSQPKRVKIATKLSKSLYTTDDRGKLTKINHARNKNEPPLF